MLIGNHTEVSIMSLTTVLIFSFLDNLTMLSLPLSDSNNRKMLMKLFRTVGCGAGSRGGGGRPGRREQGQEEAGRRTA